MHAATVIVALGRDTSVVPISERFTRLVRMLLIAAAVASLSPAPAVAAELRPCREPRGTNVYRLGAGGVGCEKAREVSRAYDRRRFRTGTFPPEGEEEKVRGFSCRTRQTGYETYRVRCTSGSDLVVFGWGL